MICETNVIKDAWINICSFDHLLEAERNARKKKRTRHEVMTFNEHLEDNLLNIQEKLLSGEYTIGPYRKKWVFVPKKRIVMALPYPDRVVQWAIYLCLNPFYDKLFIEDSYACRNDKGTYEAVERLQDWLRQVSRKPGDWYILKLDISKYFYRVNHEKLLEILSRRIKDEQLMSFLKRVVDDPKEPFGLPRGKGPTNTPQDEWLFDVGMPIGNLTSQLFGNIYLSELDQFCKHELKIHFYIRYMDDIIIIGKGKEQVNSWKASIKSFVNDELLLDLNDKTCIIPAHHGVEFVGMRIYGTHIKLRKNTVGRLKREVRAITVKYNEGELSREGAERRFASIRGILMHADSESLRGRLNEIYLAERDKAFKAA